MDCLTENDGRIHKIFRTITLNGHLLPAKKVKTVKSVSMVACRPINFYRQKQVLHYDPFSKKGFMTEKDNRLFWHLMGKLLKITFKSFFCYNKAMQAFKEDSSKVMCGAFWRKYLDME